MAPEGNGRPEYRIDLSRNVLDEIIEAFLANG